jgi:DNA excision repair protein ERCC-4
VNVSTSVAVSPERVRQAVGVVAITADVHERASRIPSFMEELGAQVEIRALTRGDYVVGPGTVVERKTVYDLHLSIMNGRFWHQMHKIRRAGTSPHLVVEGPSVFAGRVSNDGIRGACLAVSDLGIAIIHTQDARDTAAWLYRLAVRRQEGSFRTRPRHANRARSAGISPGEAALAAAPDVSVITARRVLATFGSLRQVCEASVDDLQTVPGVGIKRATAIAALIHDPWNATSAH